MRRPTGLEWVAWALHAGADAIDRDAARSGLPFRSPPELKALAEAFVNLATIDAATVAGRVANDVAEDGLPDDGRMHVEHVAQLVDCSRRTVERRARLRGVPLRNGTVRAADVERLK